MDEAILKKIELWEDNLEDQDLLTQLQDMKNAEDQEGLFDAFYRDLEFGTAGLRGVIGVGTNRMNIHTVAQATQGLADYLNAHYENPSVAIARDSRNKGEQFQAAAAQVLAANGIRSYIYPRIEPVPALSFAVRYLHASAGIALTASHNPSEYNGYKAYDENGCQIANEAADEISAYIANTSIFLDVKSMDFDEAVEAGLINWTDDEVLDAFIQEVYSCSVPGFKAADDFSIVYTPLNGAGMECVSRILDRIGVKNVYVVPEQKDPDGNFPTCSYPNPEIREALELGLKLCEEVKPDLLLATDPYADRMGVAVPHKGEYKLLTGNEMGILLIDWLCRMAQENNEDLSSKVCVSTIVSSAMPDALADHYGFEMRRVLTGFKYIGGQIDMLKAAGEESRFTLGFEESYGYLVGTHVRDKDAIVASMLCVEMASWYAQRGLDLYEAMDILYKEYGYFMNGIVNVSFPGATGAEKMSRIMGDLRDKQPEEIGGFAVEGFTDYAKSAVMPCVSGLQKEEKQILPCANVLEFRLEKGNKIMIRPSGTEPKIKAYIFSHAENRDKSLEIQGQLADAAKLLLS